MIRYCKQIDDFSCGPTVIANTVKWSGRKFSLAKNRKKIIKACGCSKNGTSTRSLERGLAKYAKKYFTIELKENTFNNIVDHTKKEDSAVLLKFRWPNLTIGHYVLITNSTPKGAFFTVINLYGKNGKAVTRITKKIFKKLFFTEKKKLLCWFLTKKEN